MEIKVYVQGAAEDLRVLPVLCLSLGGSHSPEMHYALCCQFQPDALDNLPQLPTHQPYLSVCTEQG